MSSRRGRAPSMRNPNPVPVHIITLGRCINEKCRALLSGPRPGPRVQRIFITCPVCKLAQRIDRKVIG